jgi:hypothetical protein
MIAIQAQMIPLLQEDELNWYALIVLFQNFSLGRKQKIPVVPVADRPYFFLPSLLFFQRD